MAKKPSPHLCLFYIILSVLVLVLAAKISSAILGQVPMVRQTPEKAFMIFLANSSTALGVSLFIAIGAPHMDRCSDAALALCSSKRAAILRDRDRRLRGLLARSPGVLAAPLAAVILASSLLSSGIRGLAPYVALILSPHTYLEATGLYVAIRGGVASYVLSDKRVLARSLAASLALLLAGGIAEAYVFPGIYGAVFHSCLIH